MLMPTVASKKLLPLCYSCRGQLVRLRYLFVFNSCARVLPWFSFSTSLIQAPQPVLCLLVSCFGLMGGIRVLPQRTTDHRSTRLLPQLFVLTTQQASPLMSGPFLFRVALAKPTTMPSSKRCKPASTRWQMVHINFGLTITATGLPCAARCLPY